MCFSLPIPQYSLGTYHILSSRNWGCPVNNTQKKNSPKNALPLQVYTEETTKLYYI